MNPASGLPGGVGRGPADAGARRRHPAARATHGELHQVAVRFAQVLVRAGVSHPVDAAALVVVRGARRQTIEAFAAGLGVAPDAVRAVEAGREPLSVLGAPVALLTAAGAVARRTTEALGWSDQPASA